MLASDCLDPLLQKHLPVVVWWCGFSLALVTQAGVSAQKLGPGTQPVALSLQQAAARRPGCLIFCPTF
eukprot:53859-Pelagomonas_calceolata.AAC.2